MAVCLCYDCLRSLTSSNVGVVSFRRLSFFVFFFFLRSATMLTLSGVFEDSSRQQKYFGMWSEGMRQGPGLVVTADGLYYEGTVLHGCLFSSA